METESTLTAMDAFEGISSHETTSTQRTPLGFIGTGTMGEPMAMNLVKAGTPMIVWNRSREKTNTLASAGATVAADCDEVFVRCCTILLMVGTPEAIDAIVKRGHSEFAARVRGHAIVILGTPPPEYSQALEGDIRAAGGCYVEAPVSGSRAPAEAGRLVGMLAGEPEAVERIRPLLSPMCHTTFHCGDVPGALHMKLAINLYMIAVVTGLVESMHFAERHGVDLKQFMAILDAGPMASPLSRIKAPKLASRDFSVQAAASVVLENTHLITEAARKAHASTPLFDAAHELLIETVELGFGGEDLVAMLCALEMRLGG
ncbi:3-hydroxyisobutyrate dehydrogenase [Roseimicrobium gellanilyticum]|uniref:3-hydroxyisobutyrate dehydrogenase n=1 Tax=Roseimicrobium gellanilyticum TaxID=748857 RepID=A0A366HSP5_9BACT|nr:NAD(P)-dependent oxidoreductase [Roseimicrobium gellanilyticum]RBP45717.1 3-hydroxyisobutyrate dehydrogenase [Roseimicrobium gellanilyticum]